VLECAGVKISAATLSKLKSLRHQIRAADKSRFAKEYLLYSSAAEISQDVLNQLYRAFVEGEERFTFQDNLIPSDLLGALVGMELLITRQFAASA